MSIKPKLLILTGLTCSGKTTLLRHFLDQQSLKLNIICGDLLHSHKNFNILTNNTLSPYQQTPLIKKFIERETSFKLYNIHDLLTDSVNAFDFSLKIKSVLDPTRLNIIEGGTAFYLYFLRTKILQEFEPISVVLYYDHNRNITNVVRRSKEMFLSGGVSECVAFEKAIKESGKEMPRLVPIGYEVINELIRDLRDNESIGKLKYKFNELKKKIETCFRVFVEKQRHYSSTQLKYLKKYFEGKENYWINVIEDAKLMGDFVSGDFVSGVSERNPDFSGFLRSNNGGYQKEISAKIAINFSDEEIFSIMCQILEKTYLKNPYKYPFEANKGFIAND